MMNKLIIALAMISAATAAPSLGRRDDCHNAYDACIAAGIPEVSCQCILTACVGEDNARARAYCATATANLTQPTPTGIPGGCNPAHPGSCPSSSTYQPIHPSTAAPTATPTSQPDSAIPKPVAGEEWTIRNMTRYCDVNNQGCDYNFAIEADGKTERCTVIRHPGANAATENWTDQPCSSGSEFNISWSYIVDPISGYAVIAVVKGGETAWFGIPKVNDQPVTPSNPYGSGQFGDIGPEQVYTY
ncbi:hypothetical protein LX32DRAFT_562190 [Colletotrichum zoysiae]|uniref:Extracellular membrane protein CFEM domain-containing protein n=1 Tax=Colletotrichum zoysiae TaxID=1216348 RepID=A0AAD9M4X9_9PEZI|nr:hypothetical protein LX32DRAFT_562190 [Colletotrichum zoysiae]